MPDAQLRQSSSISAKKLLIFSAFGMLISLGLCGLGLVGSGHSGFPGGRNAEWPFVSGIVVLCVSAAGFVIGTVWQLARAIAHAFRKKSQ